MIKLNFDLTPLIAGEFQTPAFYKKGFDVPESALKEFYSTVLSPESGAHKTFGKERSLVKIYNNGKPVNPSAWAHRFDDDEGFYRDQNAIVKAVQLKSSIIFDEYYRYSKDIRELLVFLQKALDCYCGCNAYLSQAQGLAFNIHKDAHHVLVFAVSGKKHWKVYNDKQEHFVAISRMYHGPNDEQIIENGLHYDEIMNPGDVLFIPAGQYHQVENLTDNALHYTVSISHYPALRILHDLVDELANFDVVKNLSEKSIKALNALHPVYAKSKVNSQDIIETLESFGGVLKELATIDSVVAKQNSKDKNKVLEILKTPSDELLESLAKCSE